MFTKYTKKHKKGTFVGFIKSSECRMEGELISQLCLFCLKEALKLTINLNKFLNLNKFKEDCFVLNNDNFWMYLFLMCCVLYAPMCLLRLADLQSAAMDKLFLCFAKRLDYGQVAAQLQTEIQRTTEG